jgi:hypothetical protein
MPIKAAFARAVAFAVVVDPPLNLEENVPGHPYMLENPPVMNNGRTGFVTPLTIASCSNWAKVALPVGLALILPTMPCIQWLV